MTRNFVAGAYLATFATAAIGQTEEGFTISHQFFKRLVTGDAEGDSPQDAVYRGREQFVEGRLIEANEPGIASMVEPYGATLTQGVVGTMDIRGAGGATPVPYAGALVLTAVTGTVAANEGPATITLGAAVLAEGFPVAVLYAPDLRMVPFRLRCYAGTNGDYGSVT